MSPSLGHATPVRGAWIVVVVALLGLASPTRASSQVTGSDAGLTLAPVVAPDVARVLLRREGKLIRSEPGVTVEVVGVPRILRSPGTPRRVFRVRVPGRFAPRALPYVLEAGGDAVAVAVPAPNMRSVVALTDDASVLSGGVQLTYAGRPAVESRRLRVDSVDDRRTRPPSPGPYEVVRKEYDFGDRAFQPTELAGKVEVRADVHYPAGLLDGPYPIVLFMHGNHASCYRGDRAGYRWPCRAGWTPLPNHEGYDYAAARLASYGYIVVSVSANGVNVLGNAVADTGMRQRGELLEEHLDLWRTWSTTGGDPFGDRFVDAVDMTRIGTMGHSRGGEGVVWHVIVDSRRADPYGIDAVLPIAPVDFTRKTVNRVPLAIVLPYCDGDVSDLQGVHMFDDARYRVAGDPAPKHTLTLHGANHNFFNTVWTPSQGFPGAFDDAFGRCEGRLRAVEQRRLGVIYIVSFFRRYLGEESALDPVWTGERVPAAVDPAAALMAYLAPDRPARRLDVDRFTDERSISRTESGDIVDPRRLSLLGWCRNTVEIPCVPGDLSFTDAHLPGLSRGVLGWSRSGGEVRFSLGDGSDVRAFDAVQFRVAVNPGYRANSGVAYQDLSLELVDGSGRSTTVTADDVGNEALRFPVGVRRFTGHVLLQQQRFPLERFDSLDLADVREIVIRFDRTTAGVIDVADLVFSAGA